MKIGANYNGGKSEFVVWAPNQTKVSLVLPEQNEILKMDSLEDGYWQLKAKNIKPNARYMFRLADGVDRPDPVSHFQPDGVFGSSAIVDHSCFQWKDGDWLGFKLKDMIVYELHIGTFSRQGTFGGAKSRVAELSEMGVNAVELMPVSQFSGTRNWGYDGVYPFAVHNSYGGPEELKQLVQEFHSEGIAVILDVVYNHFGPEGNFLKDFGPYFLFNRMTPWGASINFDGPSSVNVRDFFFENAFHWFKNYHIDGLRLDAVFEIIDKSPKHFLKELSEKVEELSTETSRKLMLIAENDHVDPEMIKATELGGYGLDALWHDNLHHSIHAILTGERNWYYSSFTTLSKIAESLNEGYENSAALSAGQNSMICSRMLFSPSKLVVFSQNHDQVGNRPLGDRLITIAGIEAAKLAAGIVILSSFNPLLFMGEEYGEDAPFLFFTDYSDKTLGEKVRVGRAKELKKNGWKIRSTNPPQDKKTFAKSKINWDKRIRGRGKQIINYYKKLINLRRLNEGLSNNPSKTKYLVIEEKSLLFIEKELIDSKLVIVGNFSVVQQGFQFPFKGKEYIKVLDSADSQWAGPGSSLPNKVSVGDKLSMNQFSIAVFLNQMVRDFD